MSATIVTIRLDEAQVELITKALSYHQSKCFGISLRTTINEKIRKEYRAELELATKTVTDIRKQTNVF